MSGSGGRRWREEGLVGGKIVLEKDVDKEKKCWKNITIKQMLKEDNGKKRQKKCWKRIMIKMLEKDNDKKMLEEDNDFFKMLEKDKDKKMLEKDNDF